MPYLPPNVLQQTGFPQVDGIDLSTHIRLIEEAWRVHFPAIQYFQIDRRSTKVADNQNVVNPDTLSGEAGASKFDVLWGEAADSSKTTWVQPQGTAGGVQASDPEVFKPLVAIHARVTRVTKKKQLTARGFDANDKWIGGLLLDIPASMLDAATITCSGGDKVRWDGDEWLVVAPGRSGWLWNANVSLYVSLYCERYRHGS